MKHPLLAGHGHQMAQAQKIFHHHLCGKTEPVRLLRYSEQSLLRFHDPPYTAHRLRSRMRRILQNYSVPLHELDGTTVTVLIPPDPYRGHDEYPCPSDFLSSNFRRGLVPPAGRHSVFLEPYRCPCMYI